MCKGDGDDGIMYIPRKQDVLSCVGDDVGFHLIFSEWQDLGVVGGMIYINMWKNG